MNRAYILKHLRKYPGLKARVRKIYYALNRITPGTITSDTLRGCITSERPVIMEIGSNDGEHTRLFSQLFPAARIYCFEPDPRAAARWKRNLGAQPHVQLFELAISDHCGEVQFFPSAGDERGDSGAHDASGSIRRPKEHLSISPEITFGARVVVPTLTLDAFCTQHHIDAIDLLWMDVQGAEIDVIRGGKHALSRTRFIYTEYSDLELYEGQLSLRALLRELPEFQVKVRYPEDVLLAHRGA